MSLVAEWRARDRGNEICRTLLLRGHEPLWFKTEAAGETLVVCFQIMPDWRKAVVLSAQDDPNAAEQALDEWKARMLARLNEGDPVAQTRNAISMYGEAAVRAALALRTMH